MKNLWDIPFNSRTVWTGIASIGLGIAKLIWPEIEIHSDPEQLILFGTGLIYLRGSDVPKSED